MTDKDVLARLVSFDSTSSRSNVPIADFVCDYLSAPDVQISRLFTEDENKVNLVIRKGPAAGDERAGLILSGHLDVVPATEPQWQSDPFELIERDGAYVARGACDMKGFNALAMNLFRETDAASLSAPLALIFTHDEEVGCLGARRLTQTWPSDDPLPRSAIIGEPTSLQAVRMHKGHLTIRITLHGTSAHSGSPHLGINAIEPLAAIIQGLIVLREQWETCRTETSQYFPAVPFPVLNIARVHGGEAINVVPEQCVLDVGVRLLPGEDSAGAIHTIKAIIGDAADVEVLNDNPPMYVEDDAPIHRAVCELIGQHESHGVSYSSDGGWLSTMGIDSVLFGPGTIEVAHRPNESVPIAEMNKAKDVLERIVKKEALGIRH